MNKQAGFTLIETLIAIFILTLTIGGLLTLAANGYYSVRYSRNQITANDLIEESLEYFHNSRDSAAQQGVGWSQWTADFNVSDDGTVLGGSTPQGCYADSGCTVDLYTTNNHVKACDSTCPFIYYTTNGYYGYDSSSYPLSIDAGTPTLTTYKRTITMHMNGPDQLIVTSTVTWMNGNTSKSASQSILLTNWK